MKIRALIVMVFIAVAVRIVALVWLHPLNWDEIEFFRATDWVRQGLVPFRDFWEHHTPLQWFVFAPFAALTKSEGTAAIILMRLVQIPLWIAIFWVVNQLMAHLGISRFARWATMALAVCSQVLMIPAVEYRVDVLGCALYLGGLLLLQREKNFAAGVVFCLTGFANLRLGPLLAITVLLNRVIDRRNRKWGGSARSNWVFAGVIAMGVAALVYFVATNSLRPLYQHVWAENYLGDRYNERVEYAFLHRILVPFGIRIYGGGSPFEASGVDLAGAAILVLGVVGIVRALRHWRTPGDDFFLAFLQIANILFIAGMAFVYHYHLEIVILLMLPFVAAEIERLQRERLVLAFAVMACVLNAGIVLLRGKEIDLQYQDVIMREAHARTPPGSKVFDGVGWALRREPAWRFWFLPEMVRNLVKHGYFPAYTLADWMSDPPAAVISDRNAAVWLARHQNPLGNYVVRHYLPLWRNLWLPAMNARVADGYEWVVPANGTYRVVASRSLLNHPWFSRPLAYGLAQPEIDLEAMGSDVEFRLMHNGQPASNPLVMKKGDSVAVITRQPAAVFIIPAGQGVWFRQPPPGVTLDSEAARRTHIPTFRNVFSERTPTSSAQP